MNACDRERESDKKNDIDRDRDIKNNRARDRNMKESNIDEEICEKGGRKKRKA